MSKGMQTLEPAPPLHPPPIIYGVELEFVFGFHQNELKLGQTHGVPNTLKKNLTYFEREECKFTRIDPVDLPNHPYNSWAILEGGNPTKARPVRTNVLDVQMIASQQAIFYLKCISLMNRAVSRLLLALTPLIVY